MRVRLSLRYLARVPCILFLALLLAGGHPLVGQAQEPGPIEIELVVPSQVGPGKTFDVLIQYNAVDIKAGATINYNFQGPGRIWTRSPEPPDPAYNTWKPGWGDPKGTIKIQFVVNEGTDGQAIQHLVEVKWGPKHRKFEATTQIKYVPPTPTPTATPRPVSEATPTPLPPTATPVPVKPTLTLSGASFVSLEGQAIQEARVNQEIALAIAYASSDVLENVSLAVRFDPDVVNVDGAQRSDGGYVFALSSLPAAPSGGPLFETPLRGRIRPHADGGDQYELRAIVQLQPAPETTGNVPGEAIAGPIAVSQPMLLQIDAGVESRVVRVGGSAIVHVRCENAGPAPARWLSLRIAGLPEGFSVSPEEQAIDQIPEEGGAQERIFTVRAPEGYEGTVTLKAVGTLGQETIESEPVTIELVPATRLSLDAVVSQSTVRAGEVFYVDTICTNNGWFTAEGVTIKLIDTTGNLGVLFQDLGDIGPGESRKAVFVVEVPRDFPADAVVTMAAQATSADGTLNQSEAVPIAIACMPVLQIAAQPPARQVRDGRSVEVIVTLSNVSQCTSKEVSVSFAGLPAGFVTPEPQKVAELAPGATRHLTFNLSIPEGYLGEVTFQVRAADRVGTQAESLPAIVRVGGVSTTFLIVFILLAVVAVAAIVVGTVLYLRNR